jgi:hypothetical protein
MAAPQSTSPSVRMPLVRMSQSFTGDHFAGYSRAAVGG